jgi:hypothetical protein
MVLVACGSQNSEISSCRSERLKKKKNKKKKKKKKIRL